MSEEKPPKRVFQVIVGNRVRGIIKAKDEREAARLLALHAAYGKYPVRAMLREKIE